MLYKIKNEENPDAVAIAFDLKTPTFRHKAYAGYKADVYKRQVVEYMDIGVLLFICSVVVGLLVVIYMWYTF